MQSAVPRNFKFFARAKFFAKISLQISRKFAIFGFGLKSANFFNFAIFARARAKLGAQRRYAPHLQSNGFSAFLRKKPLLRKCALRAPKTAAVSAFFKIFKIFSKNFFKKFLKKPKKAKKPTRTRARKKKKKF